MLLFNCGLHDIKRDKEGNEYEEEILTQLEELGFPKEQVIRLKFTDRQIYFDSEIVSPQENEIFVDSGCYDGETSLDFIKWTQGKVKKIYAFEPDKENYEVCKKNLMENTDVPCQLEKSGLWSSRTELKFIAEHSAGSRLNETGTISVPVNSIDNVVKEEDNVTFPGWLYAFIINRRIFLISRFMCISCCRSTHCISGITYRITLIRCFMRCQSGFAMCGREKEDVGGNTHENSSCRRRLCGIVIIHPAGTEKRSGGC